MRQNVRGVAKTSFELLFSEIFVLLPEIKVHHKRTQAGHGRIDNLIQIDRDVQPGRPPVPVFNELELF